MTDWYALQQSFGFPCLFPPTAPFSLGALPLDLYIFVPWTECSRRSCRASTEEEYTWTNDSLMCILPNVHSTNQETMWIYPGLLRGAETTTRELNLAQHLAYPPRHLPVDVDLSRNNIIKKYYSQETRI